MARWSLLALIVLALLSGGVSLLVAQEGDPAESGQDDAPANGEAPFEPTPTPEPEPTPAPEPEPAPVPTPTAAEGISLPELTYPQATDGGVLFTVRRNVSLDLNLTLQLDGDTLDRVERGQHNSADTRVEAVRFDEEGRPIRATFAIQSRSITRRIEGSERHIESPWLGHTFVAELSEDGESVLVYDVDGEERTGDAATVIAAEFEALRRGFPLLAFLAEQERAFGQEIAVAPELGAGLFALGDGLSLTELAVTPRHVREPSAADGEPAQPTAVFALRATLAGEVVDGVPAEVTLTGELHVNMETGWPQRLNAQGNITVSASEQQGEHTLTVRGQGTINVVATY